MQPSPEIVRGKSVAVVANAPELLKLAYGDEIDDYDLVIRMNHGVPNAAVEHAIGTRTSILTGGKVNVLPDDLLMVWWLKHTAIGDRDLKSVRGRARVPVWHMPKHYQDAMTARLGKGCSSGPLIARICADNKADQISLYEIGRAHV